MPALVLPRVVVAAVAAPTPCPPLLPLVAASLTHMANYLSSGCPRAAQLSDMLLEELDRQPSAPAELRQACRQLQEAVWPAGGSQRQRA